MYTHTARYYDAIYAWKDYGAETAALVALIDQHRRSPGRRLLDVACGTGQHLQLLRAACEAAGLAVTFDARGLTGRGLYVGRAGE